MREYISLDKVIIKQGTIFVVRNDIKWKREECPIKAGDPVMIDGRVYTALGVESFCIPIIQAGQNIGILVKSE